MTTLWAFALAIALLVVIHEFGHYLIARLFGVKVLRFSVGFGKPLYIKKSANGETEWVISMIPLGGYVKMLDEREGEVLPQDLPRAFNRQPVWHRMAIILAGPVANILLAILIYWGLFMHGMPGLKPVLGEVAAQTAAASAGLQMQETIRRIDGTPTPTWQEVRWQLLDAALHGHSARIEGITAEGGIVRHTLSLDAISASDFDDDFLQKLGLQPYQPPVAAVIGKLAENSVAERAGLRAGDRIIEADHHAIEQWKDLVAAVRAHPSLPLHLKIRRDDGIIEADVTPETVSEAGLSIGKIGAAPRVDQQMFDALMTEVSYSPLAALGQSLQKTWETTRVSLNMMGKMALGEISMKNLSGPITIADYAGQSAQMGWLAYLSFLALISISLGVLNLLPIPLLDGGHLLYYTAEWVRGKPVPEKAWDIGQRIGIALLASLMVFALYNDISRLILG